MDLDYGSIVGYTQDEIEQYFSPYIDICCKKIGIQNIQELYTKIQKFYDGYSFDGLTRVYNPFSILHFFQKCYFADYWYESGSQIFLVNYCKKHKIQSPETFINTKINLKELSAHEIEDTTAASFLLQAGYLTITERKDNVLILDFPNQEVLNSISRLYLSELYNIKEYHNLSKQMWQAIEAGDLKLLITCYNTALSNLHYSDFVNLNEYVYRSLLLMLLRCTDIHGFGEVDSSSDSSDILITTQNFIIILEFKLANNSNKFATKITECKKQLQASQYLEQYSQSQKNIICGIVFINEELHSVIIEQINIK
ncbi:MAG: AAA family ATPase [Desulfovibrionaceae bacterium]|nr:AAA family ATPase [Desulfovibrionaceae bacterium]